jgi:DNA replication protein DnaC
MLSEEIRADLTKLGYKGMLKSFNENGELKELSTQFQQTFKQVIKAEVSYREARSLIYRLELAKLPQIKTFDQLDLTNLLINQGRFDELKQFAFIEQRENILLIGASGTGKTHIAIALGYEAIRNGYRVKHYRFSDLAKELLNANQNGCDNSLFEKLKRFDLLIIDELGYLPIDKNAGKLLFELFSMLYEATSLIITTHLSFDEWDDIFGNKKSTKAIIDRITHHCQIIETGNKSWRLKTAIEDNENKKAKGG